MKLKSKKIFITLCVVLVILIALLIYFALKGSAAPESSLPAEGESSLFTESSGEETGASEPEPPEISTDEGASINDELTVCDMGEQLIVRSYPRPRQGIDAPDFSELHDTWEGELGFTVNEATKYKSEEALAMVDSAVKNDLSGIDFEEYCYIELDITIENISAYSSFSETDEFEMSMVALVSYSKFLEMTSDRVIYTPRYFKDSNNTGHKHLYFNLPIGEKITTKLGFLIRNAHINDNVALEIGHNSINRNAVYLNDIKEEE